MTRSRRPISFIRGAIAAALCILAMVAVVGCSASAPIEAGTGPAAGTVPGESAAQPATESALAPSATPASDSASAVTPTTAPKPTGVTKPAPKPPARKKPKPDPRLRITLQQATVTRVVDGDTAWVRITSSGATEKVRFIGVDTPENTIQVEPYGAAASAYSKRLLKSKTVYLETDVEKRDRYGRLLAYIWMSKPVSADRDGRPTFAEAKARMFNAWLARDGYAQVMTIPPNVKYEDCFRQLQGAARSADKGLWKPGLTTQPNGAKQAKGAFVGNRNSQKFHKPSCRWASAMSAANKVGFANRAAAVKAGYVPCKVCRP